MRGNIEYLMVIIISLIIVVSCQDRENDGKLVCEKFIKAISTKDQELFYNVVDLELLKRNLKIDNHNLHEILFLKYSPLKIHSKNLEFLKENFKQETDLTINLFDRNKSTQEYRYDVKWTLNQSINHILVTVVIINGNQKISNMSFNNNF